MHDNFGPSPFNKIAPVISGLGLAAFGGFIYPSDLLAIRRAQLKTAIWREQLVAEIAGVAGVTIAEAVVFCASSEYSLELIKTALQEGAKLDEEDIKRTMEQRAWKPLSNNMVFPDIDFNQATVPAREQHTFIVTLPDGDRRTVKAAYMEVDGGSLYFNDEDQETILAFGPGHWIWAERIEEDERATPSA
jgi:hypothetical protein